MYEKRYLEPSFYGKNEGDKIMISDVNIKYALKNDGSINEHWGILVSGVMYELCSKL
jgi:hypothetical protein